MKKKYKLFAWLLILVIFSAKVFKEYRIASDGGKMGCVERFVFYRKPFAKKIKGYVLTNDHLKEILLTNSKIKQPPTKELIGKDLNVVLKIPLRCHGWGTIAFKINKYQLWQNSDLFFFKMPDVGNYLNYELIVFPIGKMDLKENKPPPKVKTKWITFYQK